MIYWLKRLWRQLTCEHCRVCDLACTWCGSGVPKREAKIDAVLGDK